MDSAYRHLSYSSYALLVLSLLFVFFLRTQDHFGVGKNNVEYDNSHKNDVYLKQESTSDPLTTSVFRLVTGHPIDINSATLTGLSLLPGIGGRFAERIIVLRSEIGCFASVEELLGVEGIGKERLGAIREYIEAGSACNPSPFSD